MKLLKAMWVAAQILFWTATCLAVLIAAVAAVIWFGDYAGWEIAAPIFLLLFAFIGLTAYAYENGED